jgi:AcrR family transcriptional regulator
VSSLYYYFPSKEDILQRIVSRYMERLLAAASGAIERAGPGASATEKARLLIRESVISLINDRQAAGITISQARELPPGQLAELNAEIARYERMYTDVVREGVDSGEFIATDAALAVFLMLGAQVRLSAWYRPEGRLSPEQVADTYSFLLVRSLVADQSSLRE